MLLQHSLQKGTEARAAIGAAHDNARMRLASQAARVVVLDSGRVVLDAAADEIRGAATSVSGPAIAVAEFTAGRTVWNRRRIGSQESAVVAAALDDSDRARAAALRLHLEPLTMQQVVVQVSIQTHAVEGTRA